MGVFAENAGKCHVLLNDAYSGTGTFGVSLHLAFAAMQRAAEQQNLSDRKTLSQSAVSMVSTRTACDADSTCRNVLQSLNKDCGLSDILSCLSVCLPCTLCCNCKQDFRPHHVSGKLEDRLCDGVLEAARDIESEVQFALDQRLSRSLSCRESHDKPLASSQLASLWLMLGELEETDASAQDVACQDAVWRLLLDRYMGLLARPNTFKQAAPCFSCSTRKEKKAGLSWRVVILAED